MHQHNNQVKKKYVKHATQYQHTRKHKQRHNIHTQTKQTNKKTKHQHTNKDNLIHNKNKQHKHDASTSTMK